MTLAAHIAALTAAYSEVVRTMNAAGATAARTEARYDAVDEEEAAEAGWVLAKAAARADLGPAVARRAIRTARVN